MQIIFYSNNEDKRKVNKTLGTAITITGHLTSETSLVNPVLEVGYNPNLSVCNYVYIEAFRRYYFITDISVSNKTMIIKLHCDVLMSFKTDILSSRGVITRTNTGNKYLTDNMIKQTTKIKRQVKRIGTGFSKNEQYIIQIGG